MTIVEFLLARIADDEAVARRASAVTAVEWVANGSVLMHIADPGIRLAEATATVEHYGMDDAWRHAERHDPARVLAECQAKRAIIDRETGHRTLHKDTPWQSATFSGVDGYELYSEHGSLIAAGEDADRLIEQYSDPVTDTPVLRILAAVHADHPDYRDEWQPT